MKRGQSSIEYLIALAVLLIILVAMFELSYNMGLRKDLIASRMEGEKISAKLSQTMDWAAIGGENFSANISSHSYPRQSIILSGSEAISLGPQNSTIAISPSIANLTIPTGYISSIQDLGVENNGQNLTISQLG